MNENKKGKELSYPGEYPDRIYLNRSEDCETEGCYSLHEDTTWCGERMNAGDVEYIRADIAAPEPVVWEDIVYLRRELMGAKRHANTARLEWGVSCMCTCAGCETLDKRLRVIAGETP